MLLVAGKSRIVFTTGSANKGICLAWRPADENPIIGPSNGSCDTAIHLTI